jgi:hypothetical protein
VTSSRAHALLALPFLVPVGLLVASSRSLGEIGFGPFAGPDRLALHGALLLPVGLLLAAFVVAWRAPGSRAAWALLAANAVVWILFSLAEATFQWVLPGRWPGWPPVVRDAALVGYGVAIGVAANRRWRAPGATGSSR